MLSRSGAASEIDTSDPARSPPYVCMAALDYWYESHAHSEIQLMRRVATSRRVLFVNSIGLRMPWPGRTTQPLRRILRKARSVARTVRRPISTIPDFVVFSPLVVPLYGSKWGRAFNAALVRIQLALVCRALRFDPPVMVVTAPTAWPVIKDVRRRALIVNKADKFSTHPEVDQEYISEMEQALLVHADRVVYASHALMEEDASVVNGRGAFLDHGVDLDRFDPDTASSSPPVALRGVPHPRIGYFGSIDDYRVDMALLERVARELPEATLVLIGDVTSSLTRFDGVSNMVCLGAIPHEDVPAYGAAFDVALMPYLDNEWIRYSNPIKAKEYLALGLPVVATDVPELHRLEEHVLIARDADEFIGHVRTALAGHGPSDPTARRRAVASSSWDERAMELIMLAEARVDG